MMSTEITRTQIGTQEQVDGSVLSVRSTTQLLAITQTDFTTVRWRVFKFAYNGYGYILVADFKYEMNFIKSTKL